MALASILLFTAPLPARPTRTLARPAAHRLIVTQPAPRLAHSRTAHPHDIGRTASATRMPAKTASARTPATESSSSRHSRQRSLTEERALASRSAIAAADRGSRPESRTSRPHRAESAIENSAPVDELAEQSTALTNVGGVMRPAAGTLPLKSIGEEAATPVLLPKLRVASLYDSRGRLIMPAPLYGSREILLHQNQMAARDGLDRVRDDADLLDLRRENKLVALPDNQTLRVDYRLPENRRFSRPWTVAFLTVLAADFYSSFHAPLQVDSAVRTVEVQQRLLRTNGNAAPVDGDTASPHLTGQAVDIAKGGLSRIQVAWLRTYLQPLIDLGRIDVEEEFQQSCFHISVYRSFLPTEPARVSVAAARQIAPESLNERSPE
jgi:Family of unknown function (DUF5715)